jgi:multiple sugar transport system permease protein/putative aldouronate transport system permease protein
MIVATMYFNAGIIPWYLTMRNLHLTNNFWGYILPAVVSPFYIILTKTFVESIPKALPEAAQLDGASVLQIFTRIMLPVMQPILATVAIFSAVGQWNAFQDTLLLMTDTKLYSLQFILYQYLNQASSLSSMANNSSSSSLANAVATTQTATSIRMTITIIVVIPIMLVYPIFQRYFVKGIMIGAVKG